MKVSGKVGSGSINNWLHFGGDPHHRLDTAVVFRIRHCWEIRKVVSTDCAARRCRAGHALAGIAIATMMSLRHRPLAEVCTVPVLLFRSCSVTGGVELRIMIVIVYYSSGGVVIYY